nr:hypothetical protein [Methanoculleus sp. MH98A]
MYVRVMQKLYGKSLILESPDEFHPVLRFYFTDAIAHIDYTIGILAYNLMSPKNIMSMEYMRWRLDEEKVGDREHFPGFINWLKEKHPDRFEKLPMLWTGIYDRDDPAHYQSFRIMLNPDDRRPLPAEYLSTFIDEFFDPKFIKLLYNTSSLARLFDEYVQSRSA